jgi:hypothetical protein
VAVDIRFGGPTSSGHGQTCSFDKEPLSSCIIDPSSMPSQ